MKVLNHLNIMELFEVIETWVTRCLVTEYSGIGEVFSYLLDRGCRKEKEAWGRFCQIVSSVQYCHWKSIIYKNLKTGPAFGCWPEHQDCRLWLYQWVCHWQQESGLYSPYAFWNFPRAKNMMTLWRCVGRGVILYMMVTRSMPFGGHRQAAAGVSIPYSPLHTCSMWKPAWQIPNPQFQWERQIMKDSWMNMGHKEELILCQATPYLPESLTDSWCLRATNGRRSRIHWWARSMMK